LVQRTPRRRLHVYLRVRNERGEDTLHDNEISPDDLLFMTRFRQRVVAATMAPSWTSLCEMFGLKYALFP